MNMNIDEMSEQEKSVALARAMGWAVDSVAINPADDNTWFTCIIVDSSGSNIGLKPLGASKVKRLRPMKLNLYDPANMALAWRVLRWWKTYCFEKQSPETWQKWADWLQGEFLFPYLGRPDAQRLWLDKILALAIAAEIILQPSSDVRTRTYILSQTGG
jgi:hypothetical protein